MPVVIDAPAREGIIQVGGKPATVYGEDVQVGQAAPSFTVVEDGWGEVQPLQESAGCVRILVTVPSLDTETCDRETRRFNVEAAGLSEDIRIYVLSTDFPMAQKRWCAGAGVDRLKVVSDVLDTDFSLKYGLLIKERRWMRRAIFIVDREGILRYVAYMPKLGIEPDYDEVVAAAKALL